MAGLNWTTGHTVSLYWGTSKLVTSTVLTTATVGADTRWLAQVVLPTAAQGTWTLWATDGTVTKTATYKIAYAPHVGLSATAGAIGVPHAIAVTSGSGFAPNETITVSVKSPTGTVTAKGTLTADAYGNVGATPFPLTLPAYPVTGTFTVMLTGWASKARPARRIRSRSMRLCWRCRRRWVRCRRAASRARRWRRPARASWQTSTCTSVVNTAPGSSAVVTAGVDGGQAGRRAARRRRSDAAPIPVVSSSPVTVTAMGASSGLVATALLTVTNVPVIYNEFSFETGCPEGSNCYMNGNGMRFAPDNTFNLWAVEGNFYCGNGTCTAPTVYRICGDWACGSVLATSDPVQMPNGQDRQFELTFSGANQMLLHAGQTYYASPYNPTGEIWVTGATNDLFGYGAPPSTPTPSPSETAIPATATPSDTAAPSDTPTDTPTDTAAATDTPVDTATPSDTPTDTSVDTATPSDTPTDTAVDTATPSDTPTDTPVTATYTPTVVPTPQLVLDRYAGQVGASVQVTVTGFGPSEVVDVTFQGQGAAVASCTTDSTGTCETGPSFTVPSVADGAYQVTATGETSQLSASATFVVVAPAVSLSPASGGVGTSAQASFGGFGAGEQIAVSFDGTATGDTCQADATGACTATFVVPAVGVGSYQVTGTGASTEVSASASYQVVVALSPAYGLAGSSVSVTFAGFESGEQVDVSFDGGTTGANCVAGDDGECTATFTVPNDGWGAYQVSGTGETSQTTEFGPIPDRVAVHRADAGRGRAWRFSNRILLGLCSG